MPSGDPPNNNWANQPYGHIYIGDPIPNVQDSAGNNPFQWVGNGSGPGQLVLGGGYPHLNPYTVTYVEPKDGDFRWDVTKDCAEIYEGNTKQWIPILTGAMLRQIYGEVKQAVSQKDSFTERFRDVICEAEGIELESVEERKHKEYVEEMVARVKKIVLEAVKAWAEKQQQQQDAYPGIVYSTSTGIVLGNPT